MFTYLNFDVMELVVKEVEHIRMVEINKKMYNTVISDIHGVAIEVELERNNSEYDTRGLHDCSFVSDFKNCISGDIFGDWGGLDFTQKWNKGWGPFYWGCRKGPPITHEKIFSFYEIRTEIYHCEGD